MATPPVSKLGGLSTFCVFNRDLGCADEEASIDELLPKVLYFFPSDTQVEAQLKHVGFCEGLIDFQKGFGCDGPSFAANLTRRRYLFQLWEPPSTWAVMAIVNPLFRVVPGPSGSGAASATPAAPSGVPSPKDVSDAILHQMMSDLRDQYRVFYGSFRRVLDHSSSVAFFKHINAIRKRIRKKLIASEHAGALRHDYGGDEATESDDGGAATTTTATTAAPAVDGAGAGSGSGEPFAPPLDIGGQMSPPLDPDMEEKRRLEPVSPLASIRYSLREFLDFTLFYTDLSRPSIFNELDGLHIYPTNRSVYRDVGTFVDKLRIAALGAVDHVTVFFDGHIVWGSRNPHSHTLYKFLRLYSLHYVSPSYVSPQESPKAALATASRFHTGAKPAPATPPPLVAASAVNSSLKGFQRLPLSCPVLRALPVTTSFLMGLRAVLPSAESPAPPDGGGEGGGGTSDAGAGAGAESDDMRASSTSPMPDDGGADSVRAIYMKDHPGEPLFAPSLFSSDPDAPQASHRILLYQHQRMSLLLYVNTKKALFAPRRRAHPPKGVPPADDVSVPSIQTVCSEVEGFVGSSLPSLSRSIETTAAHLQKHATVPDLDTFLFFNTDNKALRLSGMGCAIGTTLAEKGNSMVTSATLTSRSLLTHVPRPLLLSADVIRERFRRAGDSNEEAIMAPVGGGAVVARKLGVREVFVFFEGQLSLEAAHLRVLNTFNSSLKS